MNVRISSRIRHCFQFIQCTSIVHLRFRFVTEEKVLEIEVEAGVADGYEIPFMAEGERNSIVNDLHLLLCR